MNILGFGKKEQTIEEIEEDTENLEAQNRKVDQEVDIERKNLIIKKLKARGLELNKFSGNNINEKLSNAFQWLKSH